MTTVLYIDHSPKPGGATRVLLNVLDELDCQEFEPVIICAEGSHVIPLFQERGYKVEPTPLPWFTKQASPMMMLSYAYQLVVFAFTLRGLVRKYRASMVCSNGFITAIYCAIPARLLIGRPLIWHMHDILEPGLFNKLFIRLAVWGSREIICVSKAVRESLIDFGAKPAKCRVIYNHVSLNTGPLSAVDIRTKFGLQAGRPVLGIIGNISRLKGHLVLLQALKELREAGTVLYCLVVGETLCVSDDEYRQEVNAFIVANRLSDTIVFTGFRKDSMDLIAGVDVVVHPATLPDSLPTAILEAMVLEKPVIASRIGGIPEIVEDGVSGFLTPPGDSSALAMALSRLLKDDALRVAMGREGKRIVEERFSRERFRCEIRSFYEGINHNIFPGSTRNIL
ncbi:MAG: glycosyltransferase family 4 protein [Thermodesulfovibrionales bacterium]